MTTHNKTQIIINKSQNININDKKVFTINPFIILYKKEQIIFYFSEYALSSF